MKKVKITIAYTKRFEFIASVPSDITNMKLEKNLYDRCLNHFNKYMTSDEDKLIFVKTAPLKESIPQFEIDYFFESKEL